MNHPLPRNQLCHQDLCLLSKQMAHLQLKRWETRTWILKIVIKKWCTEKIRKIKILWFKVVFCRKAVFQWSNLKIIVLMLKFWVRAAGLLIFIQNCNQFKQHPPNHFLVSFYSQVRNCRSSLINCKNSYLYKKMYQTVIKNLIIEEGR